MKPQTLWQRLGRAVRGYYFIIGSALVVVIVLAAAVGPEVAPYNPALVRRLQWIDGELRKAPIPPGDLYLLGTDDQGRDQLTLLLYGARTTLAMASAATLVRMLLGLVLGTVAGWRPGRPFDRAVTALIEFWAAVPGLILAMLVVFAVGIRRGPTAFIVALSLVGWGEVAQIVRGHVLAIRSRLYITASRAVGLSSAELLSRHVLPNLLPTLLSLAALEMGAVLLLLGELGFVRVFIGGGIAGFDLGTFEAFHYFDVPDWGAMLGSSWRWFRSYPWFPGAPALAFSLAILGFNLFGYGLQRFVERGRFYPSGWSVLRFLLVSGVVLLGARGLLQSAGTEGQFARLARQFDGERAWSDIITLAQSDSAEGPRTADEAAQYIVSQFEEAGLTPVTTDGSYLQPYTAFRGQVTTPPAGQVLGPDGEPVLQLAHGISLDPWQAFQAQGTVEAELVVMANTGPGALYGEGLVLLLNPAEEVHIRWSGPSCAGILRMVPDEGLARNDRPPPFDTSTYSKASRLPSFPNLLIGESDTRKILAEVGVELREVRRAMEAGEEVVVRTGLTARLEVGLVYQEVPAANVVGYIAGMDRGSMGERILVAAAYNPPPYPGADENASGVAVMLETARLLHDLELVPRRTVVFAAFAEGGGDQFLIDPVLPTTRSDIWTAVILHGLGAGETKLARLEAGSGLARAFDQSARRFKVRTQDLDEWLFFSHIGRSRLSWSDPTLHTSYQALAVARPGDELSGTPGDTIEHLDPEQLVGAGQTVAHFVMVLGSR